MTVSETNLDSTNDQHHDLKRSLTSLTPEQLIALRLCYFYRLTRYWVRDTGGVNIFLGGLTFLLGVGFPGDSLLKTIQTLFGIVTLLVSVWLIISPLPIGVPIWGILFGIAGAWNILIAIHFQNIFVGVLGLLQLWWAYSCYLRFRKNSQIALPDNQTLRLYDDLRRAVQRVKGKNAQDPDFIQLKLYRRWWQGFLLQDKVVLASRQGLALIIADKSKTTFSFRDGKGVLGKHIAGAFDLDGVSADRVTFPQTTFERYNRWKYVPDVQTTEWLNKLDANTKKRLPFRIAIILVLALPILFLILLAVSSILLVVTYGK